MYSFGNVCVDVFQGGILFPILVNILYYYVLQINLTLLTYKYPSIHFEWLNGVRFKVLIEILESHTYRIKFHITFLKTYFSIRN